MSLSPATALMVAQGTSVVTDAASAYMSSSQRRSTSKLNAALAEISASDAVARANAEAAKVEVQGQRGAGKVRAQVAGSGFTVGKGTAADLEAVPEFIANLDAAAIRRSGQREALGHRTDAAFRRAEAASESPWAEATGTMVGSASRVASYWYRRNNPQVS